MRLTLQTSILWTLLAIAFVSGRTSAATEVYTITNLAGTSIDIIDPFYDGVVLKAKRAADRMSFSIAPESLTKESWDALNVAVTKRMRISLRMKAVSFSRRDNDVSTDYGTYEDTRIAREFLVNVSSTSYFSKQVRIVCYWISGRNVKREVHELNLSRDNPFEIKTGGSARQFSLKGLDFGGNYREAKDTDFVVVAENMDGSICEIAATRDGGRELIERFYEGKGMSKIY